MKKNRIFVVEKITQLHSYTATHVYFAFCSSAYSFLLKIV